MFAYVGSFTTEKRKARGKGISVYRVEPASGAWTLVHALNAVHNPGFLALDRRQRFLYASHGDSGEISSYSIDKATNRVALLNRQPTEGDNSPHLTVDQENRYVVLANGPGIAVYPIKDDGSLAPASDIVNPPGEPGPYRREQGHGAHPHQVLFDPGGRFLVAPDKGVDRVHLYRIDSKGKLVPGATPFVKSRYGAGPRHIVFHPKLPYAYLVNELDSTVTTYHWDSGRGELSPLQVITTLPVSFTGDNTGAEIAVAPSGAFVFASNRGHDSIVSFAVDPATGTLSHVAWEPTQGKKPRFFTLDPVGSLLYVANENSDTIVAFRIDQNTGKLTPTGQVIETGSPSCIVFAD